MRSLSVCLVLAFVGWLSVPAAASACDEKDWVALLSPAVGTVALASGEREEDYKAPRPWLGVQFAEVSDAMAAQLDIKGRGVMVTNVIKESPADDAGIQRYDVILQIDGREVEGSVAGAAKMLAEFDAGDTVRLELLRHGRSMTLDVELGERPRSFEWKFDFAPDATLREDLSLRGRILRKDDDGKWLLEDLGDLEELKDLPKEILKVIPQRRSLHSNIWIDNEHRKTRIEMKTDGRTIVIERDGQGEITVSRTDEEGNTSETTYADVDELRAADEEAADLLDGQSVHISGPGVGVGIQLDSEELREHIGKWREELGEQVGEAREALEEAMKGLKGFSFSFDTDDLDLRDPERWRDHFKGLGARGQASLFLQKGKPSHSFYVSEDDSIEVRIRKGDTEIVRTFRDEKDLAKRAPDLYKKYANVEKEE